MTKAKKKTPLGRGLSELLTEGDGQQAHIKELEERTIELKKKLEDLKFENKKLLSILENLTQALIDK